MVLTEWFLFTGVRIGLIHRRATLMKRVYRIVFGRGEYTNTQSLKKASLLANIVSRKRKSVRLTTLIPDIAGSQQRPLCKESFERASSVEQIGVELYSCEKSIFDSALWAKFTNKVIFILLEALSLMISLRTRILTRQEGKYYTLSVLDCYLHG